MNRKSYKGSRREICKLGGKGNCLLRSQLMFGVWRYSRGCGLMGQGSHILVYWIELSSAVSVVFGNKLWQKLCDMKRLVSVAYPPLLEYSTIYSPASTYSPPLL
jgi:hypothetical protein